MYKNKKIIHIVATGANGEIGLNNDLLWHLPPDLKFFKNKTLGHSCISGRKTSQSFPSPLSRRVVEIVSSDPTLGFSLEDALDRAVFSSDKLNTDCIFIIGGATLYRQTENILDEIYQTKINTSFPSADTFYNKPEGFIIESASDYFIHDKLPYCFLKWIKDV